MMGEPRLGARTTTLYVTTRPGTEGPARADDGRDVPRETVAPDAALDRLRAGGVDALLVNVDGLPDAAEVARSVRRTAPAVPIVALVGDGADPPVACDAVARTTDPDADQVASEVRRLVDADPLGPGWTVVGRHDWGAPRSLGTTVVTAVGVHRDRDPLDLPPLFEAVEVDALEDLLDPTDEPGRDTTRVRATFEYAGEAVVVTGRGTVGVAE